MVKLSKRLMAIANLVENTDILVDIGSDHALLPIYLAENNIVKTIYAVDNKMKPLNNAIKNIDKYNLKDRVIPLLSDGFNSIDFDYDIVTISGMGGDLIRSILSNNRFKNDKTLILEGNKNHDEIRTYLMDNYYKIIYEEIVFEQNIYYFIIKAVPNKTKIELSKNEIKYGPYNIKSKNPLLIDFLNKNLNLYMEGLSKSKDNQVLINKIDEIKELLDEIR